MPWYMASIRDMGWPIRRDSIESRLFGSFTCCICSLTTTTTTTIIVYFTLIISLFFFCSPLLRQLNSCTTRYTGEFCESPNPCHTSSGPRCQNGGTCTVSFTNGTPSFKCHCPIGFTASLCEIPESNACDSSPCQNGGQCNLKSLHDYVCSCAQGYTGECLGFLTTELSQICSFLFFVSGENSAFCFALMLCAELHVALSF